MSHMCLKFRDIHQNDYYFTLGEKMTNSQIRASLTVKQTHIPGTSMPCLHGMGSHSPGRCVCRYTRNDFKISYLVGGLEHLLSFIIVLYILGIIIPIDFHMFQRD